MKVNTHLKIDNALCGKVTKIEEHYTQVLLHTRAVMSVDEQGLVHGGFIFGSADYAAMVAVNDPYVVLGSAQTKFIAPVSVGDVVRFEAHVLEHKGRKNEVEVKAFVKEKLVFKGHFTTFVLENHVLV